MVEKNNKNSKDSQMGQVTQKNIERIGGTKSKVQRNQYCKPLCQRIKAIAASSKIRRGFSTFIGNLRNTFFSKKKILRGQKTTCGWVKSKGTLIDHFCRQFNFR